MRPLRLILVCVSLGAVTTVGVAWALVLPKHEGTRAELFQWTVADGEMHAGLRIDRRGYIVACGDYTIDFTVYQLEQRTYSRNPLPGAVIADTPPRSLLPSRREDTIIATGWPMYACASTSRWIQPNEPHTKGAIRTEHEFTVITDTETHRLPLRPLPLGFTVDTVFYGTIWFGLIVCPGFVRRRLRARRGLCPSCGYDMRECDGVCPECGT